MKPNRTFTAIPSDNREWTRYLQGMFYARETTMTLLGCTTEPEAIARYTVSAGIVCLCIPALSGVSDDTLCFLNGLPDEILPERDQTCVARIIDNGVTAMGLVHIGTDTGVTLYKDLDGNAFTAAGQKGTLYSIIVYPLD